MPASSAPPLQPGVVHLWWVAGAAATPDLRRAWLDRWLRRVLSAYTGTAPDKLRFGREPRGRPFLLSDDRPLLHRAPVDAAQSGGAAAVSAPASAGTLQFNLSDTRDGTLVALSADLRVGVDIERLARRPSHRELAARYFAAAESALLGSLDEETARRRFLALWTAKEAACKATGSGIAGQTARWVFDASAAEHADPRLCAAPDEAGPPGSWSFRRLAPAPGHIGVLACRGRISAIHAFTLQADADLP